MKIHSLIHAPFEKLGIIETWALEKGHQLTSTHTYAQEKLPNASDFDFLIIMGGPQSVVRLDQYPYLQDEVKLAQAVIKQNKPMLGVCLGAQIIAEALGAKTQRSPHKEIGVYPIEILDGGKNDPFFSKLPGIVDVMHWHNDMPGMADGAVLLAKSEGCPHQAFRYGNKIYGFQFHLELTKELTVEMIQHGPTDLKSGKYVMTKEELLKIDFDPINNKMRRFLDYLVTV